MSSTLVVCATAPERDAAARFLHAPTAVAGPFDLLAARTAAGRVDLLVGGVGVAAAAATTSAVLASAVLASAVLAPGGYDLVVSAGIAGGFVPIPLGATVIATAVVPADLGAEDGADFLPLSALGLGQDRHDLDPALVHVLLERSRPVGAAVTGAVLTVSTVTGSASTAAARLARCPDAVAEAMEGAGVLTAAQLHHVAFAELRTVSNTVGPRDRAAWRIEPALTALGAAVAAITAEPLTRTELTR
jgi:futalosine hydrolase